MGKTAAQSKEPWVQRDRKGKGRKGKRREKKGKGRRVVIGGVVCVGRNLSVHLRMGMGENEWKGSLVAR